MQNHVSCTTDKKEQTQSSTKSSDPKASIIIVLTNVGFALGNDHLFLEKMKGDGLTGSSFFLHQVLIYSLVLLDGMNLS